MRTFLFFRQIIAQALLSAFVLAFVPLAGAQGAPALESNDCLFVAADASVDNLKVSAMYSKNVEKEVELEIFDLTEKMKTEALYKYSFKDVDGADAIMKKVEEDDQKKRFFTDGDSNCMVYEMESKARNNLREMLANQCELMRLHLQEYDEQNQVSRNGASGYYGARETRLCLEHVLNPEMARMQHLIAGNPNTYYPTENPNSLEQTMADATKPGSEAAQIKSEISELEDGMDGIKAKRLAKAPATEIDPLIEERDALKKKLQDTLWPIEQKLGLHRAYLELLTQEINHRKFTEVQLRSQGFDVRNLCVGNECSFDIISDFDSETNLFNKIINLAMGILGTLAVLLLVIAGMRMILARGDDGELGEAKGMIVNVVLGIAVAVLSYAIIQFVLSLLFSVDAS